MNSDVFAANAGGNSTWMNFENFELYWASGLVADAWELLPSLPTEVHMNARLARCEGITNGVCVYVCVCRCRRG